MKKFLLVSALSILLAGLIGCGSDDSSSPTSGETWPDEASMTADDEAKADSKSTPIGTFKYDDFLDPSTRGAVKYSTLVLKTDGTFYTVRYNGTEYKGTYVFQKDKSSGKRFIALSPTGSEAIRLQYKYENNVLRFRDYSGGLWIPYKRSDVAWCSEPAECGIQGYTEPKCDFGWACSDSQCGCSTGGRPDGFTQFTVHKGGHCPPDIDCTSFIELNASGSLRVDRTGEPTGGIHEATVSKEDLEAAIATVSASTLVELLKSPTPPCELPMDIFESMELVVADQTYENETTLCKLDPIVAAREAMSNLADKYVP